MGKSTIGQSIAERMNWPFIDIDTEIEHDVCMDIDEIFRQFGEHVFRSLETSALIRVAYSSNYSIIATGNGTPLKAVNRATMRRTGTVIHLDATTETLVNRLIHSKENDDVPNATSEYLLSAFSPSEAIDLIATFRRPFYSSTADLVIDTTTRSIAAVTEELCSILTTAGCIMVP